MPNKYTALINEESTGDPYLDISAAIIRNAIEDYRRMKKKGRDTESGLDAERFILSDNFAQISLGAIDGRELLDRIDKEVRNEKHKRKKGRH